VTAAELPLNVITANKRECKNAQRAKILIHGAKILFQGKKILHRRKKMLPQISNFATQIRISD